MKLKILGSSSKGNCYLLEDKNEILIIEAGIKFSSLKKALNFDFSKIVGCICSHEHKDHSKSIVELAKAGINIFASRGTFNALEANSNRFKPIQAKIPFQVGNFHVLPLKMAHDAAEPLGFIIAHKTFGSLLFATDTGKFPYTVKDINYAMIEANHDVNLMEDDVMNDRICNTHLNINQACEIAAEMPDLYKLILIHLSDRNSDAEAFKQQAIKTTGTDVYVAENGMEVKLSIL